MLGARMPSTVTAGARAAIDTEYQYLCARLQLTPIPLDVFICNDEAPESEETALGSCIGDCRARYGRTPRLLALPLCEGDLEPTSVAPPLRWLKYDDVEWPTWRLELWHEVIHQHSDQIANAWNPKEPAIKRPDGKLTSEGHGAGWWDAVVAVAGEFGVDPIQLSAIVDE